MNCLANLIFKIEDLRFCYDTNVKCNCDQTSYKKILEERSECL